MSKSILTSKHKLTGISNTGKLDTLSTFIDEYRRVASIIIDDIWNNGYIDNDNDQYFVVKENKFMLGSFIDYNRFKIDTFLTARALSSLVTQICGMLNSATEKQRKRIVIFNERKNNGDSKSKLKQLIKKMKQNIPQKPNSQYINLELSSKCIEFIEVDNHFNAFVRIKSFTKDKTEIYIPVLFHKHSKTLESTGKMLNSFLISKNSIDIRWEMPEVPLKPEGVIIGADQGIKTLLTCSNGQTTDEECPHGHSIESVISKMSRKKKGSKSFKRSQDHRTNIINYFINRLDFDNIKEIRFERIWNIGYKNKQSRKMSHWTNTIIRDKVESHAQRSGVRFVEQDSTYRSQRCSNCGNVRKSNRKGKIYSCKNCGTILDADLNAALNHESNLPEIPYNLRKKNLNRGDGFLWNPDGIFDFSGRSLESLLHVEDNKNLYQ